MWRKWKPLLLYIYLYFFFCSWSERVGLYAGTSRYFCTNWRNKITYFAPLRWRRNIAPRSPGNMFVCICNEMHRSQAMEEGSVAIDDELTNNFQQHPTRRTSIVWAEGWVADCRHRIAKKKYRHNLIPHLTESWTCFDSAKRSQENVSQLFWVFFVCHFVFSIHSTKTKKQKKMWEHRNGRPMWTEIEKLLKDATKFVDGFWLFFVDVISHGRIECKNKKGNSTKIHTTSRVVEHVQRHPLEHLSWHHCWGFTVPLRAPNNRSEFTWMQNA